MKRSFQSAVIDQSNAEDINEPVYDTGDDNIKPCYYREAGLRKVQPYYFEYRSYAKARWVGRTLLDVFTTEFRDRPARYYKEAVKDGLIKVRSGDKESIVSLDYKIKDRDLISHRMHRHEPPVLDRDIQIVHQEEDGLLVVNKPASIPVHPSGRYRYNSLVEILKCEMGFAGQSLSLINRLDRPTSGLVLIALNHDRAESLHRAMEDRRLRKEYICLVTGHFDLKQTGWIRCNAPLRVVEHKLGLVAVDRERGKASETLFKLVQYFPDRDCSLVLARPLTGRTHQIRVHLQYLGHPITNDRLYNRPEIWKGAGVHSAEAIQHARLALLQDTKEEGEEEPVQHENESIKSSIYCPDCINPPKDPAKEDMELYLHAYRYSLIAEEGEKGWSYSTEMPPWVQGMIIDLDQHYSNGN